MAKPIEKRQKDKEIEKIQKDKDKEIEKIQKDKDKEIEKIQKDKDVEKSIKDTKIEQLEKGGAPEAATEPDALAGQNVKAIKDSKDSKDQTSKEGRKDTKDKELKEFLKEEGKDLKDRIEKGPLPPEGKGSDPFKEFRDKGIREILPDQPFQPLAAGASVEDRLARLEAVTAEPKPIEKIQKDKDKEIEKIQKDKEKEIEKIQKDKDIEKIIKDSDKLRMEKVNIKAEHEKLVKEKPEKIEWKEWKHEKFEKIESKEFFEKDWFEGKLTDVPPVGLAGGEPQAEAAPPAPEGTVEERLARLEAAVFKMSHFIGVDLRPDLSAGALKQEPDAGGTPAPPQEAAEKAPKRRRRGRKGPASE